MVRLIKGKHSTNVVVADDGTSPVGSDEWNASHLETGMEGYTATTKTLATGKITPTDTVTVVAAETGTTDDFDLITYLETLENDIIHLFADAGDTITLRHNQSPGAGEAAIITLTAQNLVLSETLATVIQRRGTTFYQISGVDAADNLNIGTQVNTTLTETEEIWIPAGAFISATTNGATITSRETTTNVVNYSYAAFDTTTSQIIWFTWTPPANWNAGTVTYRLYWTNTAGLTTETIDFDLAAVALADDNPIDTAVGTPVSLTDTWIAQDDLHITDKSGAITIAGSPVAGEEVHFKLSRDVAADNMTGDVDIIGIQLEYSVNDIGTT